MEAFKVVPVFHVHRFKNDGTDIAYMTTSNAIQNTILSQNQNFLVALVLFWHSHDDLHLQSVVKNPKFEQNVVLAVPIWTLLNKNISARSSVNATGMQLLLQIIYANNNILNKQKE